MDNQHQKIKGYRDLSQEEIDLMNEIKAKGEELNSLMDRARAHLGQQLAKAGPDEVERINHSEPMRWLSMARTDLQIGVMKLVRAVAQPTTF